MTDRGSMAHDIVMRRWGNTIELSTGGAQPLPRDYECGLTAELSYTKKRYLTPQARRLEGTTQKIQQERRGVYDFDELGRLCTCAGFAGRVLAYFQKKNVPLRYKDVTPPRGKADTINKFLVEQNFQYRPRQELCLEAILKNRMGRIEAPTGFGKMAMIQMTCLGLPYAQIDIVTKRVAVVESLIDKLTAVIPSVGQVGGGVSRRGPRITVYTADSLHKSPATSDVLLADEGHELVADSYATQLARYRLARMYTFTASPKGRFDGTDIRLEALFGPPIFQLKYSEAVRLGLVVPIRVEWCDVQLDDNPVGDTTHDVLRKRRGIWTNYARNQLLAERVHAYPDSQVLVMVETLEHIVHLLPHLPGFQPVYATCEENDLRRYRRQGLLDDTFPILDKKKRKALKTAYEKGELRRAIATGVWAVGVDFTHLGVLARADGGASEIASIQLPGRVARVREGKDVGVVIDMRDQFDSGFRQKAAARARHYQEMEWEQVASSDGKTR